MKLVKCFAIIVIAVSVAALGAYAGKKLFQNLEEKSLSAGSRAQDNAGAPKSSDSSKNEPALVAIPIVATVSAQVTHVQTASASVTASEAKKLLGNEVAHALVNGVKVRAEPSAASKEIMRVNQGTKGHVIEHKDGWTQIKWDFNKKIGWTRDDLLLMGPQEVISTMVDSNGKLLPDQSVGSITPAMVASMTAIRLQNATKKVQAMVQNVSSAIAQPVDPTKTVRGYVAGGKLPEEGIISVNTARVRSKPDTRSELVGKIPKGLTVKIIEAKQVGKYTWFYISYDNGKKQGWTREDNLHF